MSLRTVAPWKAVARRPESPGLRHVYDIMPDWEGPGCMLSIARDATLEDAKLLAVAPELALAAQALLEKITLVEGIEPQRRALIAALAKA